jgi:26S proteasome regulatory subunit N7
MTLASPSTSSTSEFFGSWLNNSKLTSRRDLAKFIAADRIPCTIDRVKGIIETNRPDDKNKQYADAIKQGDQLITKLQKYGQAVRLRGSERG